MTWYFSKPRRSSCDHGRERVDGALELDDFAGQFVDPPGDGGVAAEQLVLDLVDVVLQPRHDGHVVVHHLVHQRVEHSLRAVAQEVGAPLQLPSHLGHPAGLGVPDGDHEVLAGEHVEFAEFHGFGLVQVPRGPQHGEEVVVVAFELGALVGRDGVFHGEPVQPELRCDGGHFDFRRPVQADPRHPAVLVQGLKGLLEALRLGAADAVNVDGVIDDSHRAHYPGFSGRCRAGRRARHITLTGRAPGSCPGRAG